MYEFRVIENESYLEDSQRLLYRVYVEEQGWWFNKNNSAGLRVKDGRLIDNRSYIATVFGLFSKDRLIGTCRVCGRVNGKFEMQEYDTGVDLSFLDKIPNLVEYSRMAIERRYRSNNLHAKFVRGVMSYCINNNMCMFGSVPYESVLKLYQNIGVTFVDKFKYEPHDKEYANILIAAPMIQMCAAIDKLDRLITTIEKLDRLRDKGESSMSRL